MIGGHLGDIKVCVCLSHELNIEEEEDERMNKLCFYVVTPIDLCNTLNKNWLLKHKPNANWFYYRNKREQITIDFIMFVGTCSCRRASHLAKHQQSHLDGGICNQPCNATQGHSGGDGQYGASKQ